MAATTAVTTVSDMEGVMYGTKERRTFRSLSAAVVHQISVLQRLKLLARKQGSLKSSPPSLGIGKKKKVLVAKQTSLLKRASSDSLVLPQRTPLSVTARDMMTSERNISDPSAAAAHAHGDVLVKQKSEKTLSTTKTGKKATAKTMPIWFQSLSQKHRQESFNLSRSSSSQSATTSSSSSSSPSSIKYFCPCQSKEEGTMCKRHALRSLWKAYFLAFPRQVVNMKQENHDRDQPQFPNLDPTAVNRPLLLALLSEEAELFHPYGNYRGRTKVMDMFDKDAPGQAHYVQSLFKKSSSCYGDSPVFYSKDVAHRCKTQLIHNYVDEESSVTFSEFVVEFTESQRHLRVCEVVQWDLSNYEYKNRLALGSSSSFAFDFDKKLVLSSSLPAIKRIMLFGKGISLLPNKELPVPVCTDSSRSLSSFLLRRHASQSSSSKSSKGGLAFTSMVASYVEALMANNYEGIYNMLCSNFRINTFDGVKTRDTFVSWLRTLKDTSSFSRSLQDLFVDQKSKTAFLHLQVEAGGTSAIVVNVVQWDVEAKQIIAIREYGGSYKLI